MNKIQSVRADIEKHFNPALRDTSEFESSESPDKKYLLEVDCYAADDTTRNWGITVATISDQQTGEVVVQLKRNHSRFFYVWITRDGVDYFVCSEDLEGQTVVDLTHRHIASYCSDSDPFIWTEFFPSPKGHKLAVIGCYWACPFAVKIYDFREPLSLPLNLIKEIPLTDNRAGFGEWISETAFSLKATDGSIQIHEAV